MTTKSDGITRFAIYFAPEQGSTLDRFGAAWLGWDAAARVSVARPVCAGLSGAEIAEITQTPARYGFHGTLKPPFRLRAGCTVEGLDRAVSALAAKVEALTTAPLELAEIGAFFALVPPQSAALSKLAARSVRDLDDFRAPARATELDKRRAAGLSARQEHNLRQWGYPYVMDDFRFHLTLTNSLEAAQRDRLRPVLHDLTKAVTAADFTIKSLCLFGDPGAGQPFVLLKRYCLSTS